MKTVTMIIQHAPYGADNKAWNALRLAGAALTEDMKVRIQLLDAGVHTARRGQTVPEGAANLEELMEMLMDCGAEVRACGMAMDQLGLTPDDLISGIARGSMKSLSSWMADSDAVLTF